MKSRGLLKYTIAGIVPVFIVQVCANSALTYWRGTDGTSAMAGDTDCPLIVEHEDLTFTIADELPSGPVFEEEEFRNYSSSYTASYEISNPSDMLVEAVLSFPFGTRPNYSIRMEENRINYDDESKYSVRLNGETLEPEVRYSYLGWREFDVDEDLGRLSDTYTNDSFFEPGLPVYAYQLHFDVDDPQRKEEDGYYINAEFFYENNPEQSRIMFEDYWIGMRAEGKDLTLLIHLPETGDITLYTFGKEFDEPEWHFVTTETSPGTLEGTCTVTESKTMTFEEFVLSKRDENSPVSRIDYYNAAVNMLKVMTENGCVLNWEHSFEEQLMKWYRYSIQVKPGETVIHEVSAPAYPSIDGNYEQPVCEYTYLLSPASRWKSFGSLDVTVKSDAYMLESTPEGFKKTDEGYTAHYEELPEGELSFRLSTVENPVRRKRGSGMPVPVIQFGLLILGAVLCLWGVVKFFDRKDKKN